MGPLCPQKIQLRMCAQAVGRCVLRSPQVGTGTAVGSCVHRSPQVDTGCGSLRAQVRTGSRGVRKNFTGAPEPQPVSTCGLRSALTTWLPHTPASSFPVPAPLPYVRIPLILWVAVCSACGFITCRSRALECPTHAAHPLWAARAPARALVGRASTELRATMAALVRVRRRQFRFEIALAGKSRAPKCEKYSSASSPSCIAHPPHPRARASGRWTPLTRRS